VGTATEERVRRRGLATLALLALALAIGGCGGDERLSRAELAEQAGALGRAVQRRLAALPQPRSLPELRLHARAAGELTASGVERLRELRPPDELEDAYERYLARAQRVVDLLDELAAAAGAGDGAAAERLLGEIGAAAETRALARAAGIAPCEREGDR
jgi:hypothetical protein